jgi:hypothetical protein
MSVAYLRRGQKCITPKLDDLIALVKTYVGCFVFFCRSFESKLLRLGLEMKMFLRHFETKV